MYWLDTEILSLINIIYPDVFSSVIASEFIKTTGMRYNFALPPKSANGLKKTIQVSCVFGPWLSWRVCEINGINWSCSGEFGHYVRLYYSLLCFQIWYSFSSADTVYWKLITNELYFVSLMTWLCTRAHAQTSWLRNEPDWLNFACAFPLHCLVTKKKNLSCKMKIKKRKKYQPTVWEAFSVFAFKIVWFSGKLT